MQVFGFLVLRDVALLYYDFNSLTKSLLLAQYWLCAKLLYPLFNSASHTRSLKVLILSIYIYMFTPWQTVLSKVTCIAFKVYILSVHAFLGDQTNDTGEETSTFTAYQVNFFICLQLPWMFSNSSYRCWRTHPNNPKTCFKTVSI